MKCGEVMRPILWLVVRILEKVRKERTWKCRKRHSWVLIGEVPTSHGGSSWVWRRPTWQGPAGQNAKAQAPSYWAGCWPSPAVPALWGPAAGRWLLGQLLGLTLRLAAYWGPSCWSPSCWGWQQKPQHLAPVLEAPATGPQLLKPQLHQAQLLSPAAEPQLLSHAETSAHVLQQSHSKWGPFELQHKGGLYSL